MLDSMRGADPARRKKLVEVLDIDESWRMHLVSDGQRRRVQIACGLLKPAQVLLLDEVTVRWPARWNTRAYGRSELVAAGCKRMHAAT
jgi:energy-coupling factor transporter ATP-binding protein EcfA2